jgi:hypothetical protein
MQPVRVKKYFGFSGVLLAVVLAGCTNAPSAVVPYGAKGGLDANGRPCGKSSGIQLESDGLSLTAPVQGQSPDNSKIPTSIVGDLDVGGWLDVGFRGIPVKQFGVKGNPDGYVEVLNIPYCVKQQSLANQSELWISRCLSREFQERFNNKPSDKDVFVSAFKTPTAAHKRCTASFVIDPEDLPVRNGQYRVRVWSAEHCYQPAYSTSVTLRLYLPHEKNGVYVPLQMNAVDGSVWHKKVLDLKGGGGEADDPMLADKLLVLRSSDGRSSDLFKNTFGKSCRNHEDLSSFPKFENGEFLKEVDCFAMTDVATFKGTLLFEAPSAQKSTNKNTEFSGLREKALSYLEKKAKANEKNPIDDNFASKFPEFIRKHITVNKFFLSVFDGLQHARRVRAFKHELDLLGFQEPKQIENRLSPFGNLFSMPDVEVGNEQLLSLLEQSAKKFACSAEGNITAGIGGLGQSFVNGFVNGAFKCNARQFMPPDTKAMEDIVLGRPAPDFFDFIAERVNIMIGVLANNSLLEKNHPLKVSVSDSPFQANLKVLGLHIKFWIDVMLLHKNPANGNPVIGTAARVLQDAIESSCNGAAAGLSVLPVNLRQTGASWFPVTGNIRNANNDRTSFEKIIPVNLSATEQLVVIPIGMKNRDDYKQSKCFDFSSHEMGKGTKVGQTLRPEKTIFGVHVNDAALVPPTNAELLDEPKKNDTKLVDYISSRVVFKFAGAKNDSFSVGDDGGDSGAMLSFLGLPSFVISTRNKNPVNGVVLAELPEPNTPDEPMSAGSGGSQNCRPAGSK